MLPGTGSAHGRLPDLQGKGKTVKLVAKAVSKAGQQHYWSSMRHLRNPLNMQVPLSTLQALRNSPRTRVQSLGSVCPGAGFNWAPEPAGTPRAAARGALLPAPNMASCPSHSSKQRYSAFSCILTLVRSQGFCEEGRKGEGWKSQGTERPYFPHLHFHTRKEASVKGFNNRYREAREDACR